jgi:hypothetical protein
MAVNDATSQPDPRTGNDNNDNCRCWVRDPVSGRERRAPLGEDAADVVVVGDSNTLRG